MATSRVDSDEPRAASVGKNNHGYKSERHGDDNGRFCWLESLPPCVAMDVGEMVDAAIAGLDGGEQVSIPSLPDAADREAYEAAR